MPLRNVEAFHEWVRNSEPSPAVRNGVRRWIAELGDRSWQEPSVPMPEVSNPPVYEVRWAVLTMAGSVSVVYRHWYGSDDIDLILVG